MIVPEQQPGCCASDITGAARYQNSESHFKRHPLFFATLRQKKRPSAIGPANIHAAESPELCNANDAVYRLVIFFIQWSAFRSAATA